MFDFKILVVVMLQIMAYKVEACQPDEAVCNPNFDPNGDQDDCCAGYTCHRVGETSYKCTDEALRGT